MSDGMGRELAYLSSHATNRYLIPNWGITLLNISSAVRKELSILDDRTESDNRIEVTLLIRIAENHFHTSQDEKARNLRMRRRTYGAVEGQYL